MSRGNSSEPYGGWGIERVLGTKADLPVHILSRAQQIRQEESTLLGLHKTYEQVSVLVQCSFAVLGGGFQKPFKRMRLKKKIPTKPPSSIFERHNITFTCEECLFLLCLWLPQPNVNDLKTLFHVEMAYVCLFRVGGNSLRWDS